jgi:hypothetical protein
MKVRLRSVSQVLVGLDRVGLAGLEQAFERADDSGLGEREGLVELMMEALSTRNYIPPESEGEYRKTVWREYLRHRGEDIRHLYSKVEVVVRGEAGDDLDRIVGAVSAVMTEHELEWTTGDRDEKGREARVASNDESLAPRGRDEVRILRGLFA